MAYVSVEDRQATGIDGSLWVQEELESISEELRIPGSKPLGPIAKVPQLFTARS